MKKMTTVILLLVSSIIAGAASLTLLTAELQLPGGTTNKVSFSYPGAASLVAPTKSFTSYTNGTISVFYNSVTITNLFVAKFSAGIPSIDMTGFPTLRYGQNYTFVNSATNAAKVLVTYEISAP